MNLEQETGNLLSLLPVKWLAIALMQPAKQRY